MLAAVGTLGIALGGMVHAQDDAGDLRRELDALRADYEKRIGALENRIKELEQEPAPAPPPPAAPARPAGSGAKSGTAVSPPTSRTEAARPDEQSSDAEKARTLVEMRREANAEFQGTTEIRDITHGPDAASPLAERVENILEGYLDITGYFRAGYGRSDQDGSQVGFGIPGMAKYRLGNEAENYGELAFSKTFFRPGTFSAADPGSSPGFDGPVAHANVRVAFVNPYDNHGSGADTEFSTPEIWAAVANVIPGNPGVQFWAGNRFYRRHDIHINDFYFWDMSGGGGGVEDVPLGNGKFAAAWIGDGAESAIYPHFGTPDPDNVAGFSKTNIDLRWYDWPLLGGNGELGLVYSRAESGRDVDGEQAPDSDGFALHLVRTWQGADVGNHLHKTSLQIGNGPAKTFNSAFEQFTTEDGTFIRPDPDESWRFRLTDQFVTRPLECLSLGTSLVYQYTDFGDGAPDQHWVSGGLRPIWHINESFSIAFEGGVDWVSESSTGRGGTLGKFTIAPQLSFGDEFFSRPVLRAFVTLAAWSDGLEGGVGGRDYTDRSSGATWGLQMESWW